MKLDIVTIFPEFFSVLDVSLIGQARRHGILDVDVHDLRDHTHDRHRTVDDTPYGGGAGMVMRPEPWGEALDAVLAATPAGDTRPLLVVPTPTGRRFDQRLAHELAHEDHIVFACGRYEGIDERVYTWAAGVTRLLPVSLGDYVLNGGEVAVTAMIEAVARLLPGVVGNPESLVEESHESGLLEYPLYTKPPEWRGLGVPAVLTSGHHGHVATWRRLQRVLRTADRRPDLLSRFPVAELTGEERRELEERGWDCTGDSPRPPSA